MIKIVSSKLGWTAIERECIDCDKKYFANAYDPGAIRCPECRIKLYRKEEKALLIEL